MHSVELKSCLELELGLTCRDPNRSKALCFDLKNGEAIYIKRKGTDRGMNLQPFYKFPLVVHLKFERGIRDLIAAHGLHNTIQIGGPTKSTGYVTLRDSVSMRHSQTPTGLGLSVSSARALQVLVEHISGEKQCPANEQTPPACAVREVFLNELEGSRISSVRREQQKLRSLLLVNKPTGRCSICSQEYPADFLVAAHIKPRQFCTEDEKRDLSHVATLMCTAGCDTAYEHGYVVVHQGKVTRNQSRVGTPAIEELLLHIIGRSVIGWQQSAAYYQQHANMHQEKVA